MSLTVQRIDTGAEAVATNGKVLSCELQYLVTDAPHRNDAIAAVMGVAPDEYFGAEMREIRFDGWNGEGICIVSASYGDKSADYGRGSFFGADDDDEPVTLSYNSSGGTKHVVHALSQTRVYPANLPDDSGGMIGWNGKMGEDMECSGVDIPTAQMQLTYTKPMRVELVTSPSYMSGEASCVGKVNSSAYMGWKRGELMYMGCSYATPLVGQKKVVVSFPFIARPNEAHAVINGIDVGSKEGNEYLWARSNAVAPQGAITYPHIAIEGIYRSKVAEYADFSKLGL